MEKFTGTCNCGCFSCDRIPDRHCTCPLLLVLNLLVSEAANRLVAAAAVVVVAGGVVAGAAAVVAPVVVIRSVVRHQ